MSGMRPLLFAATLSLAALFPGAASEAHEIKIGNIMIEHPWAKPSPMVTKAAAGFMKITNTGSEDDRLLRASSAITGNVQLHDMKMEGEIMKMFELTDGIVIPAGQTVVLKPKSLHVMFQDIGELPVEATYFKGTLVFEKAGTAEIEYEMTAPDEGLAQ
jgi:periplasmic copper chaperone A